MSSYANESVYNDCVKGISIDRSSFEYSRINDLLYVDKTMFVYELVKSKDRNFFFLSRPRRFGKSLFCSTLHALFDGKRELFEGLYIAEETDYSFAQYPVLHFNFANLSKVTYEDFVGSFQDMIIEEIVKIGLKGTERLQPARMLWSILPQIERKTGRKAVIIIDEFDEPITAAIESKRDYIDDMRLVLNDFYSVIKNRGEYIRFFFITGVVKLSNLSIFSAMNNLFDISLDESFAGAFGYTEKELEDNFGEGIDEFLSRKPDEYPSRESFVKRIKDYYDGYRFSPVSEVTVYNPVSIGMFFTKNCFFDSYWDATGVSRLAVALARRVDLSGIVNESPWLSLLTFRSFDISAIQEGDIVEDSIYALLYFTGYLTISDFDNPMLRLSFPNTEIATSFTSSLLSKYSGKPSYVFDGLAQSFYRACSNGDTESVMATLVKYFDAFSYELTYDAKEKTYQTILDAIFVLMRIFSITEDRGPVGRADEVVLVNNHLWIFELKLDRSADEALRQIEENRYVDKYSHLVDQNTKIHEIGISFSSKSRNIQDWKILNISQ